MVNIKAIPLSRHWKNIKEDYFKLLNKAMSKNDIPSNGSFTKEAEQNLQVISGRKHAFLTHSGTAAIDLMLLVSDIKAGDEVICTNYSVPASVMPVKVIGAVPVFVDINRYGQMDLSLVKKAITKKTKAILVPSLYGDCPDFDELDGIDIPILNDSAQCLFNLYKGKQVIKQGYLSSISFNNNKICPTLGTYGALFTDDSSIIEKITLQRKNGYLNRDRGTDIPYVSTNSYPHEDKAIQVICGIKNLMKYQQRRREIHEYYDSVFDKFEIGVRPRSPYSQTNYHKYTIIVNNKKEFRDKLLQKGIESQLHYTTSFGNTPLFSSNLDEEYPYTNLFRRHVLSIPCSPWHTDTEIETVANTVINQYTTADRNVKW